MKIKSREPPMNSIRERTEAAARQLEEVFHTFVILGLPLDKTEDPVIVTSGDEQLARDLIVIAKDKKSA